MKKARITFIILAGLLFYSILLASFTRNIYLSNDQGAKYWPATPVIKVIAEIPTYIKQLASDPEFYVKNRTSADGIEKTQYLEPGESYPKLLVSYKQEPFMQEFALIDLNTGSTLKKWKPDNRQLYGEAFNEKNPRKSPEGSDLHFMHPILLPDSSLIFTSQLTSLIARIDSEGEKVWLNNDMRYHHTLEFDNDGNLWSCTMPFESGEYDFLSDNYEHYKDKLIDDAITKIDPETGQVLFSKSVMQILIDNGYRDLLLAKGQFISDAIHLNDIEPALYGSDYWDVGDLLVSCRNISTVFLYRPSTNKILWLQSGPWSNQHDADFLKDSKIVIFGNDVIREESTTNPKITSKNLFFSKERAHNDVYVYDFKNDSVQKPYTQLLKSEKISTYTSGRSQILDNGDIFIEDTNNGRIIIGDSVNKKIEYVKRINENNVSSLFWSRIIK